MRGKREPDAIVGKPTVMPPMVLTPSSGGEMWFGKRLLPSYPERFAPGEYLVVTVTLL